MSDNETVDATVFTHLGRESPQRAFLAVDLGETENRRSQVVDLVDGVEVTFGRSRACTVSIDHEKVSRTHARLWRSGPDIWLEDLGSRNGSLINGTRITAATRLAPGDQITVGPAVAILAVASGLRSASPLADAAAFDVRLAAEVDRSRRFHRALAVAMLRLQGTEDAVDQAADAVARALRPMDLAAEYGGDDLVVILPETTPAEALSAMRALVEAARALEVTIQVGVASFPVDGGSPESLISAARAGLRRARRGNDAVAEPAPPAETPGQILLDPAMRRLYEMVERIADTPMTVLVLGETGVGKELVAEAIHRKSSRSKKPLIKLNCASLPETLLESELFGYERGAFTGADRRKVGYFEAADGGTLFLDEIGEMPLTLQAKLLGVLERRVITRLGGTSEIPVDVRVVCATHRRLDKEIGGRFREDLFFRISGFTLVVPPLRDRPSEIIPLAEHFLRGFAAELGQPVPMLSAAARDALSNYGWPGNVRELRNAIERAVVLQSDQQIDSVHLPDKIRDAGWQTAPVPNAEPGAMRDRLAEIERTAIVDALAQCGQNQTRAAEKLGISRRALIYKMEKYGLKKPPGQ